MRRKGKHKHTESTMEEGTQLWCRPSEHSFCLLVHAIYSVKIAYSNASPIEFQLWWFCLLLLPAWNKSYELGVFSYIFSAVQDILYQWCSKLKHSVHRTVWLDQYRWIKQDKGPIPIPAGKQIEDSCNYSTQDEQTRCVHAMEHSVLEFLCTWCGVSIGLTLIHVFCMSWQLKLF